MVSLVSSECPIRVSSVLNRDNKQFGKKYMFDGEEETCWNSDQGSPQWVQIGFPDAVQVEAIHIKFQGGFVGQDCSIEGMLAEGGHSQALGEFYPEDINSLQIFKVAAAPVLTSIKIVFQQSTDFYGRVTIYTLDIVGNKR